MWHLLPTLSWLPQLMPWWVIYFREYYKLPSWCIRFLFRVISSPVNSSTNSNAETATDRYKIVWNEYFTLLLQIYPIFCQKLDRWLAYWTKQVLENINYWISIACACAFLLTTPFDVARTRILVDQVPFLKTL